MICFIVFLFDETNIQTGCDSCMSVVNRLPKINNSCFKSTGEIYLTALPVTLTGGDYSYTHFKYPSTNMTYSNGITSGYCQ
ncbi:hypothetical protein ABIE50_002325 [Chitinophaga sp. OAE865]